MTDEKQFSIEKDGQVLGQATVSAPDENSEVRVQMHVEAGHLPVGTRQRMVDVVREAVTEDKARRLTATMPLGDSELVEGIREHLSDVTLRAAGATSIIEGEIKPA